jgi:hypothetical protein
VLVALAAQSVIARSRCVFRFIRLLLIYMAYGVKLSDLQSFTSR